MYDVKAQILASNAMFPRMRFQVPVDKELLSMGLAQKAPNTAGRHKLPTTPPLFSNAEFPSFCFPSCAFPSTRFLCVSFAHAHLKSSLALRRI